MRLINTKTLELHECFDTNIPPYAILSHTWGEDEVSFQEMNSGEGTGKAGYEKIKRCCETGASDGFEYVWIDTCCIDKTSSSELSEAINSMFSWYAKSQVCYVILPDVSCVEDPAAKHSAFRKSRWFTRGWTLQELIAPGSLIFFSQEWEDIGTKMSLKDTISEITKIDVRIFVDNDLKGFSIAQKMSWASGRNTTRIEDIAYCLMGIFDIHMPMLYGEGSRAFVRLQEEILRYICDQSIFAWERSSNYSYPVDSGSFLASSPRDFAKSGGIVLVEALSRPHPITLVSGYIATEMVIIFEDDPRTVVAILACEESISKHFCGIHVRPHPGDSTQYSRQPESQLVEVPREYLEQGKIRTVRNLYKRQHEVSSRPQNLPKYVEFEGLVAAGISLVQIHPPQDFDSREKQLLKLIASYQNPYFLRFRDNQLNYFDLELKRRTSRSGPIATVRIRDSKGNDSLGYDSIKPLASGWPEVPVVGSDRVRWTWPQAQLVIMAAVKTEMVYGKEACMLYLSCKPI